MDSVKRVTSLCLVSLSLWGGAVAAAEPLPGPNYAHAPEMHHLLHWEHFPLRVFFSAEATPERREVALAGFNEWVQATHGVVCWQLVTVADQADLTVAFTSHAIAHGSTNIIGQTSVTWTGSTVLKATIQVTEQDDDPTQLQAVAAHEFGHVLGLDGHSDDADDIMYPVLDWSLPEVRNEEHLLPFQPRTVTLRDVNTLKAAYPPSAFPSEKR